MTGITICQHQPCQLEAALQARKEGNREEASKIVHDNLFVQCRMEEICSPLPK